MEWFTVKPDLFYLDSSKSQQLPPSSYILQQILSIWKENLRSHVWIYKVDPFVKTKIRVVNGKPETTPPPEEGWRIYIIYIVVSISVILSIVI